MAESHPQMVELFSKDDINRLLLEYDYDTSSPTERVAMVLQHGYWLEERRKVKEGEIDDPMHMERYTRDCENCEHKDKKTVGGMGRYDPKHGCGFYCTPRGDFTPPAA